MKEILISKSKSIKEIGLMHGKMGFCIYCYLKGRESKEEIYIQHAEELLDEIFSQVTISTPISFDYGLLGIGFGIEFLVQNNFVQADTDKVLEEIDIQTLKVFGGEALLNLGLTDGITGCLYYLIKRLCAKKNKSNSLSFELNKEMFVLMINTVDQLCLRNIHSISKDISFDLFSDFPTLINALGHAYDLGLYNSKIERVINQLMPCFETNMPSLNINRLHLTNELLNTVSKINRSKFERQIDVLLYSVNFDKIIEEVGDVFVGLGNGLIGLKYVLCKLSCSLPKSSPYRIKAIQIFEEISKIKVNIAPNELILPKSFGIKEGLVGIELMNLIIPSDLDLNKNQVFSNLLIF